MARRSLPHSGGTVAGGVIESFASLARHAAVSGCALAGSATFLPIMRS
jgi:hypothetical protein